MKKTKKMKKIKLCYDILMFLPLVVAIVFLSILPDQIPAHYDMAGEVTRYGSKYESLLFPVMTLCLGYFLLFMGKISSKKEGNNNNNNEKVVMKTGLVSLTMFNVLNGFFLYTSLKGIENLNSTAIDINQITSGLLGVMLVVTGNIMPKAKRNAIVGLRTKWSMSSELAWQKSQKFGGVAFIVAGVSILIASVFIFTGLVCIVFSLGMILTASIVSTIYSYKVSKK